MNIEDCIEYLKLKIKNDNLTIQGMFGDIYEEIQKDNKAIETLLIAYEKNKGLEEKIKNYINIIQKELDKYKIKNTNTYLQIEGNPDINELLIQRATLEELIKEE